MSSTSVCGKHHNQRGVLSQLTIRNFAIVDRLEIDWHAGFNVITGETGAGKSILIDAVGALLGDRLGPETVRSGARRALIEGVFSVPEPLPTEIATTLAELELEPEDGALIVSREVAGEGGRGTARINGRGVPISVLQSLGERLVDIHGQSEHMALLRPREQLDYLDRFASVLGDRAEVARLFRELRNTRTARQELVANERETARLEDMLRHEIGEIESAGLSPSEEQELIAQRGRLEHVERLREAAAFALAALAGGEDEASSANDLLARAVDVLSEARDIDKRLDAEAEALQVALDQAVESARTLRDYVDELEADPQALEQTVERLFRIGDLKRKYGESVPEVLVYAEEARQRLAEIEHRTERLVALEAQAMVLEADLSASAARLSSKRGSAARELETFVARELADLRLADACFSVSLEQGEIDSSGADRVEFRLGEEARAMARVASGGELARIALALKTVLSRAETRPSLIFDEVDVGVGGRTAPVVGQKLWAIAGAGHQVLCVTHVPQVAAYADAHFAVTRAAGEVSVSEADGDQRLDELAAMLSGSVTRASRQSAKELLERAAAQKRA